MKKRILLLLCAFLMLFGCAAAKAEDDTSLIIQQELGKYDFSSWDYRDDETSISARDVIEKLISGEESPKTAILSEIVFGRLKNAIAGRLPLMIFLLCACIISALCSALIPEKDSGLYRMTEFLTCGVCAAAVSVAVIDIIKTSSQTIDTVCTFSQGAAPVLSLLLTASGRTATEAVFSPVMSALCASYSQMVKKVLLPLILSGYVFAIISALAGKEHSGKVLSFIKSCIKWAFGIITVIFTGALTVYGMGARAHDSVALKTAKYIADKAIPGAGGIISGTADTVIECISSVKTAAGAAFIIILVIMVSKTLIYIIGTSLCFRLSAALSDTLCPSGVSGLLSGAADITGFLFAAVFVVIILLIITVGMITFLLG